MKMAHRKGITLVTLGLAFTMPYAFAGGDSQTALLAEAKVTEAQAQATALAKVPHGIVKSSELELERERGRLIWSFDVAQPAAKGVTEIQVDAKTGKIVLVKKETPAQEAKEVKAEKNISRSSK